MQALLGFSSEARWIRHAHAHLGHLFRYLPGQPGYNRRLRAAAGLITTLTQMLAADTSLWPMTSGSPVPPRWNAAGPVRRPGALTWLDGLNTGTAPAIRATSGTAPASAVHPAGAARGLRAHRRQSRRAPGSAGHPGRPGPDRLAGTVRSSSRARTTTGMTSKLSWPMGASACSARPARASRNGPAPGSSNRCARSSNRSTTRSKASPASSTTAATPQRASRSQSCSAFSP